MPQNYYARRIRDYSKNQKPRIASKPAMKSPSAITAIPRILTIFNAFIILYFLIMPSVGKGKISSISPRTMQLPEATTVPRSLRKDMRNSPTGIPNTHAVLTTVKGFENFSLLS